jgi:hypothetical protein
MNLDSSSISSHDTRPHGSQTPAQPRGQADLASNAKFLGRHGKPAIFRVFKGVFQAFFFHIFFSIFFPENFQIFDVKFIKFPKFQKFDVKISVFFRKFQKNSDFF